jgi:AAA ATPase-like protein
MLTQRSGAVLLGRRRESEVLDKLLETVRSGRSEVLVVLGEAGIGKTALLDHAIGSASGFRVARAVGVQSEMELPFAGLQQLCAPMLDRLERLPGPQRDALAVAFGLSAGDAPDRFLVGLAVLSLLSEVAKEQPLLCLVDDAQWLDRASAQALAFVARRLLAEPVALVWAAREPNEDLTGLPELVVVGLGNADARTMLDSVLPGPLDERVRERLVAEARGNPLALLELPRGSTPRGTGGRVRSAGRAGAFRADRGKLSAPPRRTSGADAAVVAGRRRGAGRRPGAAVASRRTPRRDVRAFSLAVGQPLALDDNEVSHASDLALASTADTGVR